MSSHALSARKRGTLPLRRITVVGAQPLAQQLADRFVALGASGSTAIPCYGAGRQTPASGQTNGEAQLRVETVVPHDIADRILDCLPAEAADQHVTACLEHVEVL